MEVRLERVCVLYKSYAIARLNARRCCRWPVKRGTNLYASRILGRPKLCLSVCLSVVLSLSLSQRGMRYSVDSMIDLITTSTSDERPGSAGIGAGRDRTGLGRSDSWRNYTPGRPRPVCRQSWTVICRRRLMFDE